MRIEIGKDDSMNNCMRWAVYEQWNIISLNFEVSQIEEPGGLQSLESQRVGHD